MTPLYPRYRVAERGRFFWTLDMEQAPLPAHCDPRHYDNWERLGSAFTERGIMRMMRRYIATGSVDPTELGDVDVATVI